MDRAVIKKNKNLFHYLWSSLAPFLRAWLGMVEGISIISWSSGSRDADPGGWSCATSHIIMVCGGGHWVPFP